MPTPQPAPHQVLRAGREDTLPSVGGIVPGLSASSMPTFSNSDMQQAAMLPDAPGDKASSGQMPTVGDIYPEVPVGSHRQTQPSHNPFWQPGCSLKPNDNRDGSRVVSSSSAPGYQHSSSRSVGPTPGRTQHGVSPHSSRRNRTAHVRISDRDSDTTSVSDSGIVPEILRRAGGTPSRQLDKLPDGTTMSNWTEYVHLDGSIYYFDLRRLVVTPDDIQQRPVLDALEKTLKDIAFRPGGDTEMIIKGLCGTSEPMVFYLNHGYGLYIEPVMPGAEPKVSDPKFREEERTELYWKQLETFPMHLPQLPFDAEAEFFRAITFGSSERILEWTKTPFPFSEHQATRLLQVYDDLREAASQGLKVVPAQAWLIARTMARIEVSRRQVKHGTREFSMYRAVAVSPTRWQVRVADVCLVFLLFGVQRMYRLRLESVRVKGVVYPPDLRDLFKNFLAEWADSNLLATVFVSANIAFLALSGGTSIQRTASLASTLFAVTSVVSGVHHLWQHRTKIDSPEEARAYLSQADAAGADIQLAVISCFLSVPVSSLLWSILCFTVALGALCIQGTDLRGEILLAVVLGILGLLCAATLLFFWDVWRGTRREEVQEEEEWAVVDHGLKWRLKRSLRKLKLLVLRKMKIQTTVQLEEISKHS
ncbi:predicted protein [Sparassis crispa]|uniref:WW domain-containing protein n=1 Tax=Sparassis crispa TaxID=139825 RepID=A0A401GDG3_9APHY|nr:predicted protein [Sparassis crispa]GBE80207.1 predicted protein [Sparassis crispa]